MKKNLFNARICLVALAIIFAVAGCGTEENPFVVNTLGDASRLTTVTGSECDTDATTPGQQCTLRSVVQTINMGFGVTNPLVTFAPNVVDQTISLTQGAILIQRPVQLRGPGASRLTFAGNGVFGPDNQVFVIDYGQGSVQGATTFSNLTIRGGNSADVGSGIYNRENLVLEGVELTGNGGANAGLGGAIYNDSEATLTMRRCTVDKNQSSVRGGGLYNAGTATLENCTFAGNRAPEGGNISVQGDVETTPGNLTLNFCTITAGVSENVGGGVVDEGGATIRVGNSIIAGNFATEGEVPDVSNEFISLGFNLIGNDTGSEGFTDGVNSDQVGTENVPLDPRFAGNLGDKGGDVATRVRTLALMADSPAIDGASSTANGAVTTDARVLPRPVDNAAVANAGDGADIGAFEVQPAVAFNDACPATPDTPETGPIVVNSTLDNQTAGDNARTLREAINCANINPNRSTISFAIETGSETVKTIVVGAALPDVTAPVVIDGNTQDGALPNTLSGNKEGTNALPAIEIIGSVDDVALLKLVAGSGGTNVANASELRGLVITNGTGSDVRIESDFNVLAGCFLGTNATGDAKSSVASNVFTDGLVISGNSNSIGGLNTANRNLISGHIGRGVVVFGDGNTLSGNLIGSDKTGTEKIPNGSGVQVSGEGNFIGAGSANPLGLASGGNLISGNTFNGINIFGTGNSVVLNRVGVEITGTSALGNGGDGLIIFNGSNVVGGADGSRNQISGNAGNGISFAGATLRVGVTPAKASAKVSPLAATSSIVRSNFIGTNDSGIAAIANAQNGIAIDSISDVLITAGVNNGSDVPNVISGNSGDGISISGDDADNIVIEKNFIGTDASGTNAIPNGGNGIGAATGLNLLIGGDTAKGNLISGNAKAGISARFGLGVRIAGNRIGTDVLGLSAVGNKGQGIVLNPPANASSTATSNVVQNVIAANGAAALELAGSAIAGPPQSANVIVQSNFIGFGIDGERALGNRDGVVVNSFRDVLIGGDQSGQGNLIGNIAATNNGSFSSGSGIAMQFCEAIVVQGNSIGLSALGAAAGNENNGIDIDSGRSITIASNIIGSNGITSGGGVTYFNDAAGVRLRGFNDVSATPGVQNVVIRSNFIGVNAQGAARPNVRGVQLVATGSLLVTNNLIGGPTTASANVIAGNASEGVLISTGAPANRVQSNFIGVLADGTERANGEVGVLIRSSDNIIGSDGTSTGGGNTIAFNRDGGRAADLCAHLPSAMRSSPGNPGHPDLPGQLEQLPLAARRRPDREPLHPARCPRALLDRAEQHPVRAAACGRHGRRASHSGDLPDLPAPLHRGHRHHRYQVEPPRQEPSTMTHTPHPCSVPRVALSRRQLLLGAGRCGRGRCTHDRREPGRSRQRDGIREQQPSFVQRAGRPSPALGPRHLAQHGGDDRCAHRAAGRQHPRVARPGRPVRLHLPNQHRRLPLVDGVAGELALIGTLERDRRLLQTLGTLASMRHHTPSGMFYNWYDEASGDVLTVWPEDGSRVYPFLSSVDNGWLGAALKVVTSTPGPAAKPARRLLHRMRWDMFYDNDLAHPGVRPAG